jgi:hypothetical protein
MDLQIVFAELDGALVFLFLVFGFRAYSTQGKLGTINF